MTDELAAGDRRGCSRQGDSRREHREQQQMKAHDNEGEKQ
jgi:hypothetical protein